MNELSNSLQASSRLGTGWGIVIVILGVLAIMAPLLTGFAINLVVAILMIAAGITITIYAFKAGSFGQGLMQFLFGGITVVAGVAMLAWPGISLVTMTMVLAIYFVADGIMGVIAGFQAKPVKGWGWVVFSGISSIVLGGLIFLQWPFSGEWAIGVLVGARLIFTGWSMIALGAVGEGVIEELERAA